MALAALMGSPKGSSGSWELGLDRELAGYEGPPSSQQQEPPTSGEGEGEAAGGAAGGSKGSGSNTSEGTNRLLEQAEPEHSPFAHISPPR